jgi:hypothetical protein
MDALKFDSEGRDEPVREPDAQAVDGDVFEGKTTRLVDELVQCSSAGSSLTRENL